MARRKLLVGLWCLEAACVVLVALFVALGINAMLSAQLVSSTPLQAPPAPAEGTAVNPAAGSGTSNVLPYNRDLFNREALPPLAPAPEGQAAVGAEGASEGNTAASSEQPKPSDLGLTLVGTLVSSDPRFSVAQVRVRQSREDLSVHIGEQVLGATILRIGRTKVLLRRDDRGGELEILEIESTAVASAAPAMGSRKMAAGGNIPTPVNPVSVNPPPTPPPTANEGVPLNDGELRVIPKAELQQQAGARQQLAVDTQIAPYIAKGEVAGYRMTAVHDGSTLSKLGFASGDVVLSINGQRPGSEEGSLQFLDLLQQGEVVVEVDRRGEQRKLTLRSE